MEPTPLPEDPDTRIQALLDRMDQEERQENGKSETEQRVEWQKAWYLRYVMGPYAAGQLFDAWRWILECVDRFLWRWAEQGPTMVGPLKPSSTLPVDPREALRKALRERPGKPLDRSSSPLRDEEPPKTP